MWASVFRICDLKLALVPTLGEVEGRRNGTLVKQSTLPLVLGQQALEVTTHLLQVALLAWPLKVGEVPVWSEGQTLKGAFQEQQGHGFQKEASGH